MKYISRIESGNTRCYFVRVPRVVEGVIQLYNDRPENKSFPLGNGTWEDALQKAVQWRDAYLKKHNIEDYLNNRRRRFIGAMRHTGRNKSGIIGIYLGTWRKTNTDHPYWCGIRSVDGKNSHKQYGIDRYGYNEAFKLSCLFRFRHMGTLIVLDRAALPCLPPVDWYNAKTNRLYEKRPSILDQETYDKIRKDFPF